MVFLKLRQNSRITTGNSGFLLCWPPAIHSQPAGPQLAGPVAPPAGMPETVALHQSGDAARLGTKPTPVPPPRLKKQASFLEAEGGAKTLTGGRSTRLEALVPSRDSRARTRSPSPRAWRPDFPGAAREAP